MTNTPRLSITDVVADWLTRNEGRSPQEVEPPLIPGWRFEGFIEGGKKHRPSTITRNLIISLRRG